MKRIFVFAVLAGAIVPAGMVRAQGDAAAPQQNVQAPMGENPLANAAPADAGVVQPSQPRGALGGLASSAPSVAQSAPSGIAQTAPAAAAPVQGGGIAQAPASGGVVAQAPAGQAVAGQAIAGQAAVAQTGVVAQTSTTAVVTMQQSIHSRMQRHFMVQQAFQHCMFFSEFQPHVIRPQAMMVGMGHGPFFGPVAGDLVLMSIGMVADGIGDKGPVYRVTFKNNSPVAARHFRVSVIATLGRLEPTSPVVSLNIPEVAAGAVANVDVQLPAGVMSLGAQAQPGPFSQLIAVIDSFGELFETDKLNNVMSLNRGEIALIETAVAAPAAEAVAPAAAAAPAAVAPAAGPGAPAVAAPAAPAAPAPQAAPAPSQGSELDKIDLDSVSGASDLLDR